MVYSRLDPFEDVKQDLRMATLCSTIVNLAGSIYGKKGQFKKAKISDFLTEWDKETDGEPKGQDTEEMKQALLEFARAHNKALKKKQNRRTSPPKSLRKKER